MVSFNYPYFFTLQLFRFILSIVYIRTAPKWSLRWSVVIISLDTELFWSIGGGFKSNTVHIRTSSKWGLRWSVVIISHDNELSWRIVKIGNNVNISD